VAVSWFESRVSNITRSPGLRGEEKIMKMAKGIIRDMIKKSDIVLSDNEKYLAIDYVKYCRVKASNCTTNRPEILAGKKIVNRLEDECVIVDCAYEWGESVEEVRKQFAEMS